MLAAVCVAVPSVEARLLELRGGRRAGGSSSTSRRVLALAPSLAAEAQQELAWASYALLRNTNACSLLVAKDGAVLCARGQWGLPPPAPPAAAAAAGDLAAAGADEGAQVLRAVQSRLEAAVARPGRLREVLLGEVPSEGGGGVEGQAYSPAVTGAWSSASELDSAAASVLIQPLVDPSRRPCSACLILLSDSLRAFSPRDRAWVSALGLKLSTVIWP